MQLNRNLQLFGESATLKLNETARQMASRGIKVLNLSVGELDFNTPKIIQNNLLKQLNQNKYTPALGLLELREELAKKISRDYNWPITSLNVAVCSGGKQALYYTFLATTNPGDEIIIPTPAWVSYSAQARLLGLKPVLVPLLNNFDLDVKAIKKKITKKTKAIILNSPHNPTGKIFSAKSLQNLAKILAKKNIYVVADDIYHSLIYIKNYQSPVKYFKHSNRFIFIDSFSKSHALTGWRIGFLAASLEVVAALNKVAGHASGNPALPSQLAALLALKDPNQPKKYVKILAKRRELVARELKKIPNIRFKIPDGAFYFFVDIRKVESNSERFCEQLLKQHAVAIVPGEAFFAPGFVRISFAVNEQILNRGLKKLAQFIEHYKTSTEKTGLI